MKTPINELSFYYNELSDKIVNDIFNNLADGIKWDQTQYEWLYDLVIEEEENLSYLNFTFSVERISKEDFIKNDVFASSGLDEACMPHIKIHMLMEERKWIKNHDYDYAQIMGVISHELHHLTQDFELIDYKTPENIVDYFLNPIEVEAFHVGFRAESDQNSEPIENSIKRYLNNFLSDGRINHEEYEKILVKWMKPEIKLLKGVNNEG